MTDCQKKGDCASTPGSASNCHPSPSACPYPPASESCQQCTDCDCNWAVAVLASSRFLPTLPTPQPHLKCNPSPTRQPCSCQYALLVVAAAIRGAHAPPAGREGGHGVGSAGGGGGGSRGTVGRQCRVVRVKGNSVVGSGGGEAVGGSAGAVGEGRPG